MRGEKAPFLVQGLSPARAWAGRVGHERRQGNGRHHGHVVAHDDRIEPPLVGCVISNRNHTFSLVMASKECVINILTVELAAQVGGCGNTSGRGADKFTAFRLTPVPGSLSHSSTIIIPLLFRLNHGRRRTGSLNCRVLWQV